MEATLLIIISILQLHAVECSTLGSLVSCLEKGGVSNFTTYSANSSSYNYWLDFSLQNLRYATANVTKPGILVFPGTREQVQTAVMCSVRQGWELRVRSGGHSYEALSSTGDVPNFFIIDLMNMQAIDIDLHSKTAWVEAGATLGQVYYGISEVSSEYAYPAGLCPTVGVGGHISGGGVGFLSRKYGAAADNVVDAELVDANGKLLDRGSMGEDLFWALRGGGGGSWGVVVAWRITLVQVPPVVTFFNLTKIGRKQVTELLYKWQTIIPSAPDELYVAIYANAIIQNDTLVSVAGFLGQYLGPVNQTLTLLHNIFPELGLTTSDCKEVTWIESTLHIANIVDGDIYPDAKSLSARFHRFKSSFKGKSDYVIAPIPKEALERTFMFLEENPFGYVALYPGGGKMDRFSQSEIAFPHRAGNLYLLLYTAEWLNAGDDSGSLAWMDRLYKFMTPYVSQSPRAAYVNSLDLDLGTGVNANGSVHEVSSWGVSYFGKNFARLVEIKGRVDGGNVFRHPQSIPVGNA